MDRDTLQHSEAFARLAGEDSVTPAAAAGIRVSRRWQGQVCRATITNDLLVTARVREAVLFAGVHRLPPSTPLYGEGFQMLSQTAGTLGQPLAVTRYTDHGHYRLRQAPGAITVYNLASLSTARDEHLLLCFTSCRRFSGEIRFWPDRYEVALDLEGLQMGPGETWDLEEFYCAAGPDRDALLAGAARAIQRNHPRLPWGAPPTGWCSWYCYGPRVSEGDILENLAAIKRRDLPLTYVQIDDGFQSRMGDWLVPGDRFPSGLPALCQRIKSAGFEPAIWLAPFCAERDSALVRAHAEWFVQDADGSPLLSDRVSFGGWRNGPWYMLDGTHPGAQQYLEGVCRTIRQEWGCAYFKLDALMWGAMPGAPGGRRHDPAATRVEAYRRGLAAIRRGAGGNGFILGCNAPLWPSLGEVHGMRVSSDISRRWAQISQVARECFWRSWQHNRLWINDPDCVVLANAARGREPSTVTEDEFGFHAAAVLATGGMVLSGDDLTHLADDRWSGLARLLPPSDTPARFAGTSWEVAWADSPSGEDRLLFLFNWDDEPRDFEVALDRPARVSDYWTGHDAGTQAAMLRAAVPPHGARVFRCLPA